MRDFPSAIVPIQHGPTFGRHLRELLPLAMRVWGPTRISLVPATQSVQEDVENHAVPSLGR